MRAHSEIVTARLARTGIQSLLRSGIGLAVLILAASAQTTLAAAEITGTVLVAGSGTPGQPVEGATVRVQADPSAPTDVTDVNGRFTLPVSPSNPVTVVASVEYDPAAGTNYLMAGAPASNGDDVTIRLDVVPAVSNPTYTPIRAAPPAGCGDCHSEQLSQWSSSAHAQAATDVWVLDLYSGDGTSGGGAGYVFREVHPDETGFCATCHAPVGEAHDPGATYLDEVLDAASPGDAVLEGVTCSACHQLDHFTDHLAALHLVSDPDGADPRPGATFRFPLDGVGGAATHEYVWGPLDDVDYPFMKASHAPVFSSSLACASCHEYENPATGAPGQTTYSEWAASPYAVAGPGFRSCQDCHMPTAGEPGPIADPVVGSAPVRPASQRNDHGFEGATPSRLAEAIELGAVVTVGGGAVTVATEVANVGAGHAFPTGVAIRNAFLLVQADLGGAPLTQFLGPTVPEWADDDEPGQQPGDWSGHAGRGFAKVLEGTVAGVHQDKVLFFDADAVAEDSTLAAGATAADTFSFALPAEAEAGDVVEVSVRLLYRRAWRSLAVTKGWAETPSGGPIEIEVGSALHQQTLKAQDLHLFADGFESGDLSAWSTSVSP